MFKLSEIKELIKLLDQTSSVHELEIESEGMKLAIRKPDRAEADGMAIQATPYAYPFTPAPQPQTPQQHAAPVVVTEIPAASQQPASNEGALHKIVSPMVGTFYSAASPETPSFVNVGDRVSEKSTVCIIEAMKLMNELEAEVRGEIVSVLAENGQLVEYGQPLFLVKPE
ncbi:acetyl-CoA carboxylase biotin carboxyl carrier protein [Paenibacillus graminis]|uniref:Biotin carboxyl carrier protein of acetyl-CoA carboxylase n=1 Tax=Paenibacillus graminis TaxID=189425 RepID=A0A089MC94_9BACL|nr:acetyl-CoA carboxylase biotin carboxyl carrier protein [Paenibacillus graminis]AIQ69980.1 acetyl-CoA carboxylase [Paenibacillus graminis]MEC0168951.1 acetyl-CoA carboxylase biotin carboxyl carrier protein [Paenibacillus graminis]